MSIPQTMTTLVWKDESGLHKGFKVVEPDVPWYYVRVFNTQDVTLDNPETAIIKFQVMGEHDDENVISDLTLSINERAGLIDWYKSNVGYDPDQDIGEKTPILELIDRVAGIFLLHSNVVPQSKVPGEDRIQATFSKMSIEDMESLIEEATLAALDSGCLVIQRKINQQYGDNASVFFSGETGDQIRDNLKDIYREYLEFERQISNL